MYISATNPQMVNFACIGTFCSVDFGLGDALSLTKFRNSRVTKAKVNKIEGFEEH